MTATSMPLKSRKSVTLPSSVTGGAGVVVTRASPVAAGILGQPVRTSMTPVVVPGRAIRGQVIVPRRLYVVVR